MNKDKLFHIAVPTDMNIKYAILPGDPGRVDKIAAFLDEPQFLAENREFRSFVGTIAGEKVIVTSTGIGGPSAAIALEELSLIGVKAAIRTGTCGGISPSVNGGDLIIPTAAVRMEGTTREYAPIEYPAVADFDITCALVDSATELGYTYHTGVVQSKDSFYGQHDPASMPVSYELEQKWEAWKRLGVLASEMEAAALFTVGSVRRVKVGCVLNTIWNQEKTGTENAALSGDNTEHLIKTAVKALERLIGDSYA